MKRFIFLIFYVFAIVLSWFSSTCAFDISGLQPVSPHGVFSTFSTESMSRSKVALEIGAERSREPDFYRLTIKGAYGITDTIEFDITIPYVLNFSDTYDGVEDISLGIRHRFYDEGKFGPSVAVMFNASIPSGRDRLSTNGRFGVGLIISKRIAPFKGHINLFYAKPGISSLHDEIWLSSGLEFSAGHNFSLLGEILAKKSHFSDEYNQIEAKVGYRMRTTDYLHTTVGLGFDLKNRNPEYRIMLSVSYTPQYAKKKFKRIYEQE